jgi:thioredoxin 1
MGGFMANLTEITNDNFKTEVLDAKGKVLVDFWAPWCGPCRMQTPILEKLVVAGEIKAKIVKVNTDENQEIAGKYSIQSIPTLILFEDGKEVERFVGTQPENVLKNKLQ